jgi:radical SAM superfamily enzyme YgiQ (UPF0313 family)
MSFRSEFRRRASMATDNLGDAFLEPRTDSLPRRPIRDTPRVLLLFPRLPFSFWSTPEIAKGDYKAFFPPLGLLTLAALLPDHWQVSLADLNVGPIPESDWHEADLVMVSGMHAQRQGLLELLMRARASGKITVTGGPYPSTCPEELIDHGCDFVACGEGEATVPLLLELLKDASEGGVIRSRSPADLSCSPVPRFDLIRMGDYRNAAIQTSRGCPHSCEFCNISSLYGNTVRYKEPGQVIAELELLLRLGAPRSIFVSDDNFIGIRSHAKSILEAITAWNRLHGEPFGFTTQTTVALGRDLEMIDLLTAANFGELFVGIESPDEEPLTRASKRQNQPGRLLEWMETICKNGLTVIPSFILGLDGEEKGVGGRICDLVEKSAAPIAMINLLQAPPGTRLWNRLQAEGRLIQEIPDGEEILGTLNFVPDRPLDEVISEYRTVWAYLYEPSRFLARAYRYYLRMRPTRRAMALERGAKYEGPRGRRDPMKRRTRDLGVFLNLVWRQGVLRTTRRQFWRQMIGMARRNPSRLVPYVIRCVWAEHMFEIRRMLIDPNDQN